MKGRRIPTDGGSSLFGGQPFAGLSLDGLASAPAPPPSSRPADASQNTAKGPRRRIDIVREKSGRGGKVVTVLRGFSHLTRREMEDFARDLRKHCGCGGTAREGIIELQGEHPRTAREYLVAAGYAPVMAGGWREET